MKNPKACLLDFENPSLLNLSLDQIGVPALQPEWQVFLVGHCRQSPYPRLLLLLFSFATVYAHLVACYLTLGYLGMGMAWLWLGR